MTSGLVFGSVNALVMSVSINGYKMLAEEFGYLLWVSFRL